MHRSSVAQAFSVCAVVVLAGLGSAQTSILSSTAAGQQSDAGSLYPEITPDGRFVTYQSSATNLVPGDTNGEPDVFLHDRLTGTTIRPSVSSTGQEGDDDSLEPALSDDGQVIAYFSYASTLVPGDTNAAPDIFVYDVPAGVTSRVSVSSAGAQANMGSRYGVISGNGRFVAFESKATNLVAGDTNGMRDIFVHDRQTGVVVRASADLLGVQGNDESLDASISADGRLVAFESLATNLVAGDTNGVQDIFVKDLATGSIVVASVDSLGNLGDLDSEDVTIAAQGRYVVFGGEATDLVPGDLNGVDDIFVRDLVLGTTVRISTSSSGQESDGDSYDAMITPDGRFVVYYSEGSTLVAGDTNTVEDIFLYDGLSGTTERVSIGSAGQEADDSCLWAAISGDGRFVSFDSPATTFVLGDLNGKRDIFLRDRASPFVLFCPGDGTQATPCPCGNSGAPHHGCENSIGSGGGTLEASGATSPDSVRLNVSGVPANALTFFFQSPGLLANRAVFGDGVLCISGPLKRMYVENASGGSVFVPGPGDPSISARSAILGDPLTPGSTRTYQAYYRDPTAFCTNATFNLTNAVQITW